ncbi:hypothetical protein CEXT_804031 [Caerostris extrusa]|uniref:Uncharacterized protein n=1 Tax=Caerostris extrusa TaxID=172846 RepID=A0AAV4Y062_CAEEX|nr:hypothetical protein CEXT_804031 [Caerostris extrusa]
MEEQTTAGCYRAKHFVNSTSVVEFFAFIHLGQIHSSFLLLRFPHKLQPPRPPFFSIQYLNAATHRSEVRGGCRENKLRSAKNDSSGVKIQGLFVDLSGAPQMECSRR